MASQERAQFVRSVLDKLDPANPDHWTSQGVPRMDALEKLGLKITRAELTELAPGFTRPQGDNTQEGDGEAKAAREGDPEHPGFSDPEHSERENPRQPRPEKASAVNEHACASFIKLNAARASQMQKERQAILGARDGAVVRGTPLSPLDQRIAREARRARQRQSRGLE